jgi:hypothetical protein
MKLVIKYPIPVINSCLEKCDEKWAYMQLLMTGIGYLVTSFIYVCHIVGSIFGSVRFLLPVCRLSWFLYTLNIYAHLGQRSRSLQYATHRLMVMHPHTKYHWPISKETRWTVWTYMHIFHHIFLSNYWWQRSDIWSQTSYRYPISWEAFLDPSDSYFLFADERGYHKWALAHSSSRFFRDRSMIFGMWVHDHKAVCRIL